MAKNLITGGFGLFGTYLARELLENGEEVVLFQRRSTLPPSAADLEGKVEIRSGDISNWVQILEVLKKCDIDTVYHTAALLSKDCEYSAANGFRVNVLGTMNILEAAHILGLKDVIFVSSGATYGLTNPPKKVSNETPQKTENMYTTTKVCCERLGEQYHRQYGVNFRAIRYAMVVGPTRQISYYYGDWSGIMERTAQGQPYVVHSNPDAPCAYIYIKDAVRAMVELKKAEESRLRQRVYNVHGFMSTLSEVAKQIKKHLPDARLTFEWDKSEAMRTANSGVSYEMDNAVAFQDFGYQTRYLLEEMVADFIKEVRAGRAN
jgi:nucleoside-diphosphate-sugar epimerase